MPRVAATAMPPDDGGGMPQISLPRYGVQIGSRFLAV